ncbi:MAG TPA: RNA 2',3'-cyclic phosphodiesterase [Thermoplasmata archaeon]|nr:RNA 2',3'-cyclic phosphodiesterase [Thermoplasmata archaeon]
MRAFVAVEVPTGEPGSVGRAAPEHLTLQFLGEVPPESAPRIAERLRPVGRGIGPFDIRLEGIGAFPSPSDPRVVWVGVTSGRAELMELARRVHSALEGTVQARREEFVPHLTWFRVRSPTDRRRAFDVLRDPGSPPPPRSVRVSEFVLKESVLGPGGAVHRTVEAFPLAGSAGPP